MSERTYIVNHNPSGDVIHREPADEQCNIDDSLDVERHCVPQYVEALINEGHARYCERCLPMLADA